MARIMITGWIDTDDIDETLVDLTDPTGLTPDGFETFSEQLDLDEMTFRLLPD